MILVTGGAGFIGSVFIKELNQKGITDILLVDRLEDDDKWKNIRGLKYAEYVHADDLFESPLLNLVQSIVHMGACSSTTERDMDFLMVNNVEYSKHLFKIATDKNIPIVYASSAATYGDGSFGYNDNHEGIDKLRPLNPYGYSKQVFDQWVLARRETPSIWFGVKFFNVYGPNEYHKGHMSSVVYKAFKQIEEKGKVKLFKSHRSDFKDGEQLRDFVYGKDVARAMLQMLAVKDPKKSGIYNMGTGKARSFYDLVDSTFKSMEQKTNIEFIDMPDDVKNQYQYYTQAEMAKFHNLLPDFKFSSLEEGVADYVKNHLTKEDPFY